MILEGCWMIFFWPHHHHRLVINRNSVQTQLNERHIAQARLQSPTKHQARIYSADTEALILRTSTLKHKASHIHTHQLKVIMLLSLSQTCTSSVYTVTSAN